jgi:DNA-binding response OmpR family regulator
LTSLGDKSVLVVEDEAIVSFLIEDTLAGMGCRDIRLAGTLEAAESELDKKFPDLAVLDVNLGGKLVYPVAARLKANGVPFLFTTGYGVSGMLPEWQSAMIVQKPFVPEVLGRSLLSLIGR